MLLTIPVDIIRYIILLVGPIFKLRLVCRSFNSAFLNTPWSFKGIYLSGVAVKFGEGCIFGTIMIEDSSNIEKCVKLTSKFGINDLLLSPSTIEQIHTELSKYIPLNREFTISSYIPLNKEFTISSIGKPYSEWIDKAVSVHIDDLFLIKDNEIVVSSIDQGYVPYLTARMKDSGLNPIVTITNRVDSSMISEVIQFLNSCVADLTVITIDNGDLSVDTIGGVEMFVPSLYSALRYSKLNNTLHVKCSYFQSDLLCRFGFIVVSISDNMVTMFEVPKTQPV